MTETPKHNILHIILNLKMKIIMPNSLNGYQTVLINELKSRRGNVLFYNHQMVKWNICWISTITRILNNAI